MPGIEFTEQEELRTSTLDINAIMFREEYDDDSTNSDIASFIMSDDDVDGPPEA